MWPCTLRPPERLIGAVSFFSGRSLVISAKSETVIRRRAADVGLYFLIPIIPAFASARAALEEVDLVPFLEGDDGLLEIGPLADRTAHPLDLAAKDQGLDALHPHLEERLHRPGDLRLGRRPVDDEGILSKLFTGFVQLLSDQGSLDDIGVDHDSAPSSA